MAKLPSKLKRELEHKRLAKTSTAMAGLAAAASAGAGVAAVMAAPKGLAALGVALKLSSAPLIITAAPAITGMAVAVATSAGIIRFYSWYKERQEDYSEENTENSPQRLLE